MSTERNELEKSAIGYLDTFEKAVAEGQLVLGISSLLEEVLIKNEEKAGALTPATADRIRVLQARLFSLEIAKLKSEKGADQSIILDKQTMIEQLLMEVSDPRHLKQEDVSWIAERLISKEKVLAYLKGKEYFRYLATQESSLALIFSSKKSAKEKLKQLDLARETSQTDFYRQMNEVVEEFKSRGIVAIEEKLDGFEALLKDEKRFQEYLIAPPLFSPLDIIALAESKEGGAGLQDDLPQATKDLGRDLHYALEARGCWDKFQKTKESKYFEAMQKAARKVKRLYLLGTEINAKLDAFFPESKRQRYLDAIKADPENFITEELNKIEKLFSPKLNNFYAIQAAFNEYQCAPFSPEDMISFLEEERKGVVSSTYMSNESTFYLIKKEGKNVWTTIDVISWKTEHRLYGLKNRLIELRSKLLRLKVLTEDPEKVVKERLNRLERLLTAEVSNGHRNKYSLGVEVFYEVMRKMDAFQKEESRSLAEIIEFLENEEKSSGKSVLSSETKDRLYAFLARYFYRGVEYNAEMIKAALVVKNISILDPKILFILAKEVEEPVLKWRYLWEAIKGDSSLVHSVGWVHMNQLALQYVNKLQENLPTSLASLEDQEKWREYQETYKQIFHVDDLLNPQGISKYTAAVAAFLDAHVMWLAYLDTGKFLDTYLRDEKLSKQSRQLLEASQAKMLDFIKSALKSAQRLGEDLGKFGERLNSPDFNPNAEFPVFFEKIKGWRRQAKQFPVALAKLELEQRRILAVIEKTPKAAQVHLSELQQLQRRINTLSENLPPSLFTREPGLSQRFENLVVKNEEAIFRLQWFLSNNANVLEEKEAKYSESKAELKSEVIPSVERALRQESLVVGEIDGQEIEVKAVVLRNLADAEEQLEEFVVERKQEIQASFQTTTSAPLSVPMAAPRAKAKEEKGTQTPEIDWTPTIQRGGAKFISTCVSQYEKAVSKGETKLDVSIPRPAELLKVLSKDPCPVPGINELVIKDRLRLLEARILNLEIEALKLEKADTEFNISQEIIRKERKMEQFLMEIIAPFHLKREDMVWAGEKLAEKPNIQAYLKGKNCFYYAQENPSSKGDADAALSRINQKMDAKPPKLFYVKLKELLQELRTGKITERFNYFETLLEDEKQFQRYFNNSLSFSPLQIFELARLELPEIKGEEYQKIRIQSSVLEARICYRQYQAAKDPAEKNRHYQAMIDATMLMMSATELAQLPAEIMRELDVRYISFMLKLPKLDSATFDPEKFVITELDKMERLFTTRRNSAAEEEVLGVMLDKHLQSSIPLLSIIGLVEDKERGIRGLAVSPKTRDRLYALEASRCYRQIQKAVLPGEKDKHYQAMMKAVGHIKDLTLLDEELRNHPQIKPKVIKQKYISDAKADSESFVTQQLNEAEKNWLPKAGGFGAVGRALLSGYLKQPFTLGHIIELLESKEIKLLGPNRNRLYAMQARCSYRQYYDAVDSNSGQLRHYYEFVKRALSCVDDPAVLDPEIRNSSCFYHVQTLQAWEAYNKAETEQDKQECLSAVLGSFNKFKQHSGRLDLLEPELLAFLKKPEEQVKPDREVQRAVAEQKKEVEKTAAMPSSVPSAIFNAPKAKVLAGGLSLNSDERDVVDFSLNYDGQEKAGF